MAVLGEVERRRNPSVTRPEHRDPHPYLLALLDPEPLDRRGAVDVAGAIARLDAERVPAGCQVLDLGGFQAVPSKKATLSARASPSAFWTDPPAKRLGPLSRPYA